MRVTVFGATGQIGRHVVEQLLNAGHQVTALTRSGWTSSAFSSLFSRTPDWRAGDPPFVLVPETRIAQAVLYGKLQHTDPEHQSRRVCHVR
jgi:nucleoside-diphosphate-sugar epimerase